MATQPSRPYAIRGFWVGKDMKYSGHTVTMQAVKVLAQGHAICCRVCSSSKAGLGWTLGSGKYGPSEQGIKWQPETAIIG